MKSISAGLVAAVAFWVIYGSTCAVLLYSATEGVQRDLLLVLGGFGLAAAVAMAVLGALRGGKGGASEQ